MPYVYFSGNNMKNGYDTMNYASGTTPVNTHYGLSPSFMHPGVAPIVYYNSDTYQIISAGLDGQFGTGAMWPPISGKGNVDDLSNFWDRQLGSL